jgi:cytochrome c biogenesis protein CcdA
MAVLVVSLMVTGSNLSKGWLMRGLGEETYHSLLEQVARRTSLRSALGFVLGSAVAFGLVGVVLAVVSKGPGTWVFWIAYGILIYSVAVGLYGSTRAVRLFRQLGGKPSAD